MTAIRVLIADDERHIRLALCLFLRQNGFEVDTAANGKEALHKLLQPQARATPPFHLLITDVRMPGLDGLELVDRLRAKRISIPVLLITGYGNRLLANNARKHPCVGYLDKPFAPEEVLLRIKAALACSPPNPSADANG